jgi:hypothetical protein
VHAVRTARKRDVKPIVHDHARPSAPHGVDAAAHRCRQRAIVNTPLANVNQVDACVRGGTDRLDQRVGIATRAELAVGDQANHRAHLLIRPSQIRSGQAPRRPQRPQLRHGRDEIDEAKTRYGAADICTRDHAVKHRQQGGEVIPFPKQ